MPSHALSLQNLLLIFFLAPLPLFSQVNYTLQYHDPSSRTIFLTLEWQKEADTPIAFLMPRYIPGRYEPEFYDRYIQRLTAEDDQGNQWPITRDADGAPRWYNPATPKKIKKITYEMDLGLMEQEEQFASDASVIRDGYACFLLYSVFSWIERKEKEPVFLRVTTLSQWPVFCTIDPEEQAVE